MIVAVAIPLTLLSWPAAEAAADDQPLGALPFCGPEPGPLLSSEPINLPSVGMETEVEVGQSMISTVKGSIMAGPMTLAEDVSFDGSYFGTPYHVIVPAGTLKPIQNKQGLVFVPASSSFKYGAEGKERKGIGKPDIFLKLNPYNSDGLIGIAALGFSTKEALISEAHFSIRKCLLLGAAGFRRELIYSGTSKGTVSIQYREFVNDMARPAFSQELHYDLADGNEIGFRGARFQVIKATNVGIRFKLLKPLE
jgi:hypothetical protein